MRCQRRLFPNTTSKLWQPGEHLPFSSAVNSAHPPSLLLQWMQHRAWSGAAEERVCLPERCLAGRHRRGCCASRTVTQPTCAHAAALLQQQRGQDVSSCSDESFISWRMKATSCMYLIIWSQVKIKGSKQSTQPVYADKQDCEGRVAVRSGAAQTAGCVKPASLGPSRKQHRQWACVPWLTASERHPEQLGRGTGVWPG